MGLRPMLYYYASGEQVTGCGGRDCVSAVMLIGTPALWWPALPVLGFALWRAVTRFDWRYGAVLVGYGAGILPWFANMDRQMYFFYMAPVAPFLVLATALVMGEILGPGRRPRGSGGRPGCWSSGCGSGLVVANFVWLWPILTGHADHPGDVGGAAVAAVLAGLTARAPHHPAVVGGHHERRRPGPVRLRPGRGALDGCAGQAPRPGRLSPNGSSQLGSAAPSPA